MGPAAVTGRFIAGEPIMFMMDVNKVAGAAILVLLSLWVIEIIGDGLVRPTSHGAAEIKVAAKSKPGKVVAKAAPLEPVSPLLAAANTAKGKKTFKKCAACHTTEKGGKNKVGPNLWNIVNAGRGGKDKFSYSRALKATAGNWSYESLNAFLAKPKAFIPRTKMAFPGLKKAKDRANVIAYLRTLSDSPAPLP